MAWPGGKQSLKAKRVNPKRKINWEQLGLAAPTKDPSTVPIEEIRRQVTMLAGRALGQGVRSRRLLQGEQDPNANRNLGTARRDSRGASR